MRPSPDRVPDPDPDRVPDPDPDRVPDPDPDRVPDPDPDRVPDPDPDRVPDPDPDRVPDPDPDRVPDPDPDRVPDPDPDRVPDADPGPGPGLGGDERIAAAVERQRELARRVEVPAGRVPDPPTVTGVDVSYATGSARLAAAAVTVDVATGDVLEELVVPGTATFPYRPGLLAFREVPALARALGRLRRDPDLVMCDGQGLAHPRRCGLACHLGVVLGVAALGCAKTRYVGSAEPGPRRGDRAPLRDGPDLVGHALRTQDGVRPVYVSPGHRIGFDQAGEVVLAATSRFRLPEPIRRADRISRAALASRWW